MINSRKEGTTRFIFALQMCLIRGHIESESAKSEGSRTSMSKIHVNFPPNGRNVSRFIMVLKLCLS